MAVKYVGAETFRLCRDLIDGVVLVDNAATSAAIKVRAAAVFMRPIGGWLLEFAAC